MRAPCGWSSSTSSSRPAPPVRTHSSGQDCTDEQRRRRVRRMGLNGIDAIDVSTNHRLLTVTFLDVAPVNLTRANVRIDGGTRITSIQAEAVYLPGGADPDQNHDL